MSEELLRIQKEAQMAQAVMMGRFKQSTEYQLLRNTFEVMALLWKKERLKAMKTQSTREICLYFTGKEDAVMELLESIDKIIADGEAITEANKILAEYQEAK